MTGYVVWLASIRIPGTGKSWTEMPREGASLGAQTMPDNCQFLQGWKDVVLSGKETIEDMSMTACIIGEVKQAPPGIVSVINRRAYLALTT